jgi:TonB-linked SusC/RagA family outer membrane protein
MKKGLPDLLCNIARGAAIFCMTVFSVVTTRAQVAYSPPEKFFVSNHQAEARITLRVRNEKLGPVLEKIEKQSNFVFVFSNDEINISRKVTLDVKDKILTDVLRELLSPLGATYEFVNDKIILKQVNVPNALPAGGNQSKNFQIGELSSSLADITITGRVTGSNGVPLSNVSVTLKGTTIGTTTNEQGYFSLTVPDGMANGTIVISSVGYRLLELPLAGRREVTIQLTAESKDLGEVIVVGYGTQRRANVTGAISSIKGEDIITTKNENVQNMLTGKISGVRVTQRTAEPGSFNNNFDIRGMGTPLVIIDGIPRTNEDLQRLDPNDIENLSVLKDASAAIYGVRAANGVVLVTTKRGSSNRVELNYTGTYAWQIPSGLPSTVNAIDYMTLRNEAAMHTVSGGSPVFNDQQFQDYITGKKVSTNWYPLVFAKSAPQMMHNVSATGGNDKTTYYVGFGYQYQESFFKSNDLDYKKYNVRANISSKITDRISFDLSISGVNDDQNRPYQDSWWIVRSFWRQGPQIPAFANNDPTKPFHGLIEGDNPVSFMDADIDGYKKYNKKWFQSSASIRYDIPGVTGLFLKGLYSYDFNVSSANLYQKEYIQYRYDEASQTYSKFTRQSPNRIRRESFFRNQSLAQASLNYDRKLNKHTVTGLLLWEAQRRKSDNIIAQRDLVLQLPYIFAGVADGQQATMLSGNNDLYDFSNLALVGRANYNYENKYLAEFLFRYDASSKFTERKQWGFFPAASVGWRISEENFFKNISALSFVRSLKLRSSYGKTGDDLALAYQWASGYNYPTSSSTRNFTGGYVFDGSFNASADNKGIPNPNITWITATAFDVGIDFEGWNGLFGITADYFSRKREGIPATRAGGIPTVVGAGLPQENLNSDRTYGFDLELTHRNHFGKFNYNAKGLLSLARVQRLYVERAAIGSSWNNWVNNQNDRLQGVHRGLQGDGQFSSWEEIWNSPYYIGRGTLIGDYRYEDWNGDGEINGNDVHPIRYNQFPWMNFSFIFDASFKGFDMNFLLQGSAMSSLVYGEQLRQPLWGNGESGAMQQFMDRWHPVDPKADPYSPATKWVPGRFAYTGTLPDENSTFNVENGAYLRLKAIEVGYTIPATLIKRIGIKNLRVYANTYNLVTFTKVKYVDPEHPLDNFGYLYPLNKTVSVGLNVKF